MQLFSALKPYSILRLTIPLVAGIFLSDTCFRSLNLLSVHFGVMAVLCCSSVDAENMRLPLSVAFWRNGQPVSAGFGKYGDANTVG